VEQRTKNRVVTGTHHIAIQTTDWEASLHLYRDVLGMTEAVTFDNGTGQSVVLLDTGDGTHVELFEAVPGSAATAQGAFSDVLSHVALTVADARAVTDVVRAAGYEILAEPRDVDLAGRVRLTISFFRGSSGEIVELVEERTA
jgi:catechol 2,3-dioxygenase-like lactoylglutathione lyase family enzyme